MHKKNVTESWGQKSAAATSSCKNRPLCTTIRKLLQEADNGIDLGPTLTDQL